MLRDASRNFMVASGVVTAGARELVERDRMTSDTYSQDDIRNGFRAEIRSQKMPLGERVKMALAALFAVAVPTVFAAAILVTSAIWLSITFDYLRHGGNSPVVMGLLLLGNAFLLGFIFAAARRLVLISRNSKDFLSVSAKEQPELHAFVNRIAKLLGGPVPNAIKLDAEVGLVLQPGSLRNALMGQNPEMIIGLPLLYGLSARQLSGVIAHAYAGYTRQARAFGYPLVCVMDRWLFTHSGIGRSATSGREDFEGMESKSVAVLLKPFDFLVQGTFYLLYRVISAVTFVVSRRVDMIGDQFSSRIAGSSEFRSTQFRLRSLYYGQQHANRELLKSWRNSKLADNFPYLVVNHADTLQLSLRPRLIQEMEELVTPMTRSRIVDLGRIVNVEHYQDEGACYLLGAAVSLLRDVDAIARRVSLDHYHAMGIAQSELKGVQRTQVMQSGERDRATRSEVFGGLQRSGRVIRIDDFDAYVSMTVEQRCEELRKLGDRMDQESAVIHHLADTFRNFGNRKNLLHVRKVIEESQSASTRVVREIEVQWLALIKEQSDVKAELTQYENLLARQIGIALSLTFERAEVLAQFSLTAEEMRSHVLRLTDALTFLGRAYESLLRLRTYTQILGQLMVCSATETDEKVVPHQEELLERYQKYVMLELNSVLKMVNNVPHPMMVFALHAMEAFNPAAGSLEPPSIGQVLRIEIADLDSASSCPEACHRVANSVIQYMESLNEQLQDRVALLVSRTLSLYELPSVSYAR